MLQPGTPVNLAKNFHYVTAMDWSSSSNQIPLVDNRKLWDTLREDILFNSVVFPVPFLSP